MVTRRSFIGKTPWWFGRDITLDAGRFYRVPSMAAHLPNRPSTLLHSIRPRTFPRRPARWFSSSEAAHSRESLNVVGIDRPGLGGPAPVGAVRGTRPSVSDPPLLDAGRRRRKDARGSDAGPRRREGPRHRDARGPRRDASRSGNNRGKGKFLIPGLIDAHVHLVHDSDEPGELGPRAETSVKKGKTPILSAEETRQLLDSIDLSTRRPPRPCRHRRDGLSFARVGAMLAMKVDDYYARERLGSGSRRRAASSTRCRPTTILESYIDAYVKAAGIATDKKGPLFRTAKGKDGSSPRTRWPAGRVADDPQAGEEGGHQDAVGCHSFRATGITNYLRTAGRSRRPRRWPTTSRRGRPSSTTGRVTRSPSTRSSGLY